MREVAIIGIGDTKFGELWDKSFRELGIEAGLEALKDAHVSGNDIDAIYIGSMSTGRFIDQEHIGPLLVDYSGLIKEHIPAIRVEAAGASGALALQQAFFAVASGMYNIVVVGGAEKMTDVDDEKCAEITGCALDQEWESVFGNTFAGVHALMAQRHIYEYGTKREHLASVAVKNHLHGSMNPKAHFQNKLTIEQILGSSMVAEPLTTFDCAPNSDGAATVILCPLEYARKFQKEKPLVKITGSAQATDFMALHNRRDITTLDATVVAGKKALSQARKEPKDIQVAEVHDSFTISEIMAIEDLKIVPKGQGGFATSDGLTALNSKITVNPSGGLKARGQPLGATGIAQVVEIVRQLRGECDKRQVSNATVGLTQSIGGSGSTVIVHIFERVN